MPGLYRSLSSFLLPDWARGGPDHARPGAMSTRVFSQRPRRKASLGALAEIGPDRRRVILGDVLIFSAQG